jgi:N-acetyl-anhydromuramyl-L-alanine amidase AmpD
VIETDTWTFVKARWFQPTPVGTHRNVRVVVIHDMEYPEKGTAAEEVAQYFATTDTKASAHLCIDSNSYVQCVHDNDVAWAAPGCNADGIQLELAGYGRQTQQEWLDTYGIALLNLAANAAAQYCLKYGLPVCHLSDAQLKAGQKGIIGHYQASRVYHLSDHTDPGAGFPWEYFIDRTAVYLAERKARFGVA